MKRLWFIAILAACGSACVDSNNPVQLVDVVPIGSNCSRSEGLSIYRGSMDIGAGGHYITTLSIFSPLSQQQGVTVGFFGEELVLNYESESPRTSFEEESLRIFFAVEPNTQSDESYIQLDMIGDEARKKLKSVVPSAPESMLLLASVKLKGRLASGQAVETNEITFPIDVTRGGTTCEDPQVAVNPDQLCYPGQDGVPFECQ